MSVDCVVTDDATDVVCSAGDHAGWDGARTDEDKLGILFEVGVNGWTVADVARRHDLTRQHMYQWRREMRRKELWPETDAPSFLPAEIASSPAEAVMEPGVATAEINVVLCNGRQLRLSVRDRGRGTQPAGAALGDGMIGPGTGVRVYLACGVRAMAPYRLRRGAELRTAAVIIGHHASASRAVSALARRLESNAPGLPPRTADRPRSMRAR